MYVGGYKIVGRWMALAATLCVAVSPWVVYYNSQALLDTTMVALISTAFLLLWYAIHHPRLYLLLGMLVGLAVASKYPAGLTIGGMILFAAYYYFILRLSLPQDKRPTIPWKWWIVAAIIALLAFFLADPPIWADPIPRLLTSLQSELGHSESGHISFWAGQVMYHVPPWMIFYVLWVKVSSFITIPAAFFLFYALFKIGQFHFMKRRRSSWSTEEQVANVQQLSVLAFLFSWLTGALLLYGQLNILVGAHYYLPVAPPLAFAGNYGLTIILRSIPFLSPNKNIPQQGTALKVQKDFQRQSAFVTGILLVLAVGPHLLGLLTVYQIDGYTSEFVHGSNDTTEVGYDAYKDADNWLLAHTTLPGRVGIVGGSATTLWYISNPDRERNLQFIVTLSGESHYDYDYLVWPMNLQQRHLSIPSDWSNKIVHVITGGATTYCFILARNPATLNLNP